MVKGIQELKRNIRNYNGVTSDSRLVRSGFIFVAVRGLTSDGHDYIPQVIENGAKVVVGENPSTHLVRSGLAGIEYIQVADSRLVLGELASEFYGNPSSKLKVIGVTGTKGKTTTVHIIHHILTKLGKKAGLLSSISVPGLHVTTPDTVYLHKSLKEFVDEGCEYAIMEVSSHGIDQKRISGVKFDVGVLTNIAPEHLDYHKTLREYKKVKMSFVESCGIKVISPKSTNLKILPGEYNNVNAETAVKVVEKLGLNKEDALNALKSFELPEGRLDEIPNKLGIKIFIDFAHTPDSLNAVLTYLKTETKGKLISVFGCAGERDPYKRPKMGDVASKKSDYVILTSEDPRTENVNDIISQIRSGVKSKSAKIYEIPDRSKAIKFAIKLAKKGDLVGIFGKGHEKSMNLDGKKEIPWSDRETVIKNI